MCIRDRNTLGIPQDGNGIVNELPETLDKEKQMCIRDRSRRALHVSASFRTADGFSRSAAEEARFSPEEGCLLYTSLNSSP